MTPEEKIDKAILDYRTAHKDKEKGRKEIRDIVKEVFPGAVVTPSSWGDVGDVLITFPKVVKVRIYLHDHCRTNKFTIRNMKDYKHSRVTFQEVYGSPYTREDYKKFPFETIKKIYEEYKANEPKLEGNILPSLLKQIRDYLPEIQLSFSNAGFLMEGEHKIYRYDISMKITDQSPKWKHIIDQDNGKIILHQCQDDHLSHEQVLKSEFDLSDPKCFEKIAETLMQHLTHRLTVEMKNHNKLIRSLINGQRTLREWLHVAERSEEHVRKGRNIQ